ncbi:hypothetical protein [Actinoplanes palleronii]|uniref:Uncharacterized protein n=1 Tax=Actinoplanes palleronii TaxID=113570 RepID=A0ABQ4BDJ4_9ACTN|nr:hypothetical protein [Actinoplanes palleronii]GIE68699.1 hypothetical protein Apa02nite_048070 [Actinoplanes palleronii]
MPDANNFRIGSISGGQNNLGGDGNVFNQQNNGLDAAQVGALLGRVRANLADFADPEAAARTLTELEKARPAELAQPGRIRTMLDDLVRYAAPGTEALAALTALVTALNG